MQAHRILFVCMGNICRSPTAEGVFRKLAIERGVENLFEIDSAGTGGWHIGNPPDQRAQQAALQRGIDLSTLRARQVSPRDIEYFDTLIAMDRDNLDRLRILASKSHQHKIKLLLEYCETPGGDEVPDPYYGGEHGFDLVLDLIEDACDSLIESLGAQR